MKTTAEIEIGITKLWVLYQRRKISFVHPFIYVFWREERKTTNLC